MAVHWKWHWQESLPAGVLVLSASALLPGLFLDTFWRQLALASSFDEVRAATFENTTVCVCISLKSDLGHGWIIYVSNGRCCWFYLLITFSTFMNFYSAYKKYEGGYIWGLFQRVIKIIRMETLHYPWDPGKTQPGRRFFSHKWRNWQLVEKK